MAAAQVKFEELLSTEIDHMKYGRAQDALCCFDSRHACAARDGRRLPGRKYSFKHVEVYFHVKRVYQEGRPLDGFTTQC